MLCLEDNAASGVMLMQPKASLQLLCTTATAPLICAGSLHTSPALTLLASLLCWVFGAGAAWCSSVQGCRPAEHQAAAAAAVEAGR